MMSKMENTQTGIKDILDKAKAKVIILEDLSNENIKYRKKKKWGRMNRAPFDTWTKHVAHV